MKTFKSTYLNNDIVPNDCLILNALEDVGYEGFLPKTFIADLLIVSKSKLFRIPISDNINPYVSSVCAIVKSATVSSWVRDTMYLLKRIGQKYNLKVINKLAANGEEIDLSKIGFSYNYTFNISNISDNTRKLLNITDNHMSELERLPEDVISAMTIANGLGSFLKTSKQIVSDERQMTSYGDITKIRKHSLADPLFKYKFSIKAYELDTEVVVTRNSNKIVIGYFFGNYKRQGIVGILLKLLGVIVLNNFTEDIKIVVYSFFSDTYVKKELSSIEEVIQYFSESKQLKLFSINNTKSLETMLLDNPGDDIIFLPNVLSNCLIKDNLSGANRVNVISVEESRYNLQYSNVCKKTGGTFLTI